MIDILFEISQQDERDLKFVEIENMDGESVKVGAWLEDELHDGKKYRRLRIKNHEV